LPYYSPPRNIKLTPATVINEPIIARKDILSFRMKKAKVKIKSGLVAFNKDIVKKKILL